MKKIKNDQAKMPLFSARQAIELSLIDESPEQRWCYLYDSSTEMWVFIGPPVSPVSVMEEEF